MDSRGKEVRRGVLALFLLSLALWLVAYQGLYTHISPNRYGQWVRHAHPFPGLGVLPFASSGGADAVPQEGDGEHGHSDAEWVLYTQAQAWLVGLLLAGTLYVPYRFRILRRVEQVRGIRSGVFKINRGRSPPE